MTPWPIHNFLLVARVSGLSNTPVNKINAFTIIELLVSLAILAIVTTLGLSFFQGAQQRTEMVKCMGNVKNIHVALSAQMQDTKRWPQVPENLDETGYQRFWRTTLAPYGADSKVWRCPSSGRFVQRTPEEEELDIDYAPAEFDDTEFAPFENTKQPWVVESGDFHGEGNVLITAGGTVVPFNKFYSDQTGQKPPWAK